MTNNRRDFLQKASVALPIVAATAATAAELTNDNFQPEEFWRDRMTPPDDGKKLGWFVDSRRCIGCHACEVSCKSENDVPLGNFIRQTFYQDVGEYPKVARMFMPMSCQHCEDAPCIKACPCGALHKTTGGTVAVDYESCCGHGSCVDACPYGAIYLDPVAKQAVKCHNCYHRTELGEGEPGDDSESELGSGLGGGEAMEPACVPTCPAEALYFGDLNDPESKITKAMDAAKEAEGELSQLRPEKETRPRMWFAGVALPIVEKVIPTEGESFKGESYDIYRWKEASK
ncbi:4Fe-4S dicluster domain-containing protein [Planctomycetes bacterium K23_9]|uniref:Tetrathionate reductase subunit B n=1 Tax=Stieleria marina TaxID=1930275 RepID=A0A517NN09_9BACT|nr:Tetrathionate reductase subunit B precursor [Planctomycetes bacterium K23_9]